MASRFVLIVLSVLIAAYMLDEAAWLLRGSPVGSVSVSILTAMEFKSGKEDFGEPDVEEVSCGSRAFPSFATTGPVPPCWWVKRHTQVLRRP